MIQNKNDLINSKLQHGCVVDKNLFTVFPTSGFLYLTMCSRQSRWKVAMTSLVMRTKSN